jgi:hypothetical protein
MPQLLARRRPGSGAGQTTTPAIGTVFPNFPNLLNNVWHRTSADTDQHSKLTYRVVRAREEIIGKQALLYVNKHQESYVATKSIRIHAARLRLRRGI